MMLNRRLLSTINVSGDLAVGPLDDMPEKIIQFGDGRFMRAFVDWMVDEANSRGLFLGKVVIIKNRPGGNSIDLLNQQEGLYTVVLRGLAGKRVIEKIRIVTAVSRGINPFENWPAYAACAENPALRFVISNTTESGLKYVAEDQVIDQAQKTFPANLAAFLYRRFKIFAGSPARGMIILPCELLEDNGLKLKEAVLGHASAWGLPAAFAGWLNRHNFFLNTLVDRIVTGYPEGEDMESKLGYKDLMTVCGEPYHLWAIEGPEYLMKEFPLLNAGLNIHWKAAITPYRVRKMRLLNGSHTLLAPISLLRGRNTIRESLADPKLAVFLRDALYHEILPTLELPEAESRQFADSVMERFKNPFIVHYWSDIMVNSTAKINARLLPSLIRYFEEKRSLPSRMVFSLACLAVLYRQSAPEEEAVKKFFADLWTGVDPDNQADILRLTGQYLSNRNLWDCDLTLLPGLVERSAGFIRRIITEGIDRALAAV